jgi:hypothetical protein
MALEITGKLTTLLEPQTGNGRNGTWTKRDFVIETTENYPKQICFAVWGDKVAELNSFQIGESLKISFDPSSREFNGRWYTELKAWKVERLSAAQSSAPDAAPAPSSDWLDSLPASEKVDDLPF